MINIALLVLLPTRCTEAVCGDDQTYAYVIIPNSNTLMSWQDYDTFVVGTTRAEVYYGIPKPTDPAIRTHVFSTVTKGVGTYIENLIAESADLVPTCKKLTVTHTPLPGSDRAIFYDQASTEVDFFWSSCPAKYYWYMYCATYTPMKKKCAFAESELALYVNGTLDDAPMVEIIRDLCRGTDVKFGATSFKWFFTYGENKLCS